MKKFIGCLRACLRSNKNAHQYIYWGDIPLNLPNDYTVSNEPGPVPNANCYRKRVGALEFLVMKDTMDQFMDKLQPWFTEINNIPKHRDTKMHFVEISEPRFRQDNDLNKWLGRCIGDLS
jgi:hypothetical protein